MTHQIQTESNESLPFLVWDTCDIAIQQAKFLVENGEADDEDEAFHIACEDQDLLDFEADDGKTFLANILPKTDCTFKVFLEQNIIRIQNFHHDSPTGNEWYTVRPAKALDDEFEADFDEVA
ncbi:MAG: hypothetical protein KJ725_16440 [Gammaproteobacteria bacterium]|nr:hypothetical protein [Gammaproteobacteria bacterium]